MKFIWFDLIWCMHVCICRWRRWVVASIWRCCYWQRRAWSLPWQWTWIPWTAWDAAPSSSTPPPATGPFVTTHAHSGTTTRTASCAGRWQTTPGSSTDAAKRTPQSRSSASGCSPDHVTLVRWRYLAATIVSLSATDSILWYRRDIADIVWCHCDMIDSLWCYWYSVGLLISCDIDDIMSYRWYYMISMILCDNRWWHVIMILSGDIVDVTWYRRYQVISMILSDINVMWYRWYNEILMLSCNIDDIMRYRWYHEIMITLGDIVDIMWYRRYKVISIISWDSEFSFLNHLKPCYVMLCYIDNIKWYR